MPQTAKPPSLLAVLIFRILGLAALIVFAGLFFLFTVSPPPDMQTSSVLQRMLFLAEGAMASGLVPAILAAYFWLVQRNHRAYRLGLGFVTLFVIVHYLVAVVMAHGSTGAVVAAVAIELTLGAGVLLMNSRHHHLQRAACEGDA